MTLSAANAQRFIDEVCASGLVWAIRDKEGYPTFTNGSGQSTMPFWSSETKARRIIETIDAYAGFTPTSLELNAFRQRWLVGLERDNLLVGLNWSGGRATGHDLDACAVEARLTVVLDHR